MNNKNRGRLSKTIERSIRGACCLLLWIVVMACWKPGLLYAASELENSAADSRTAAAISELSGKNSK